jgi:hypothetical protein
MRARDRADGAGHEAASGPLSAVVAREKRAFVEAILEAADSAGLAVTVSVDQSFAPHATYMNAAALELIARGDQPELRALFARSSAAGAACGAHTQIVCESGERIALEVAFSVIPHGADALAVALLRRTLGGRTL